MRTTLDIDEDVLRALREAAEVSGMPMDRLVSQLLREVLRRKGGSAVAPRAAGTFRPFPAEGRRVTDELVERIREREGI